MPADRERPSLLARPVEQRNHIAVLQALPGLTGAQSPQGATPAWGSRGPRPPQELLADTTCHVVVCEDGGDGAREPRRYREEAFT